MRIYYIPETKIISICLPVFKSWKEMVFVHCRCSWGLHNSFDIISVWQPHCSLPLVPVPLPVLSLCFISEWLSEKKREVNLWNIMLGYSSLQCWWQNWKNLVQSQNVINDAETFFFWSLGWLPHWSFNHHCQDQMKAEWLGIQFPT